MNTPLSKTKQGTFQPGYKRHWGQLPGSASSLAIANAAESYHGLTIVITPDTETAHKIESELLFYCTGALSDSLLHFPDWETLPYDNFSPHPDIVSARLRSLYQLPQVSQGVLIVPVSTMLLRLPPKDFLQGSCLILNTGQTLNPEVMRRKLESAGYISVDTVFEHGEFAIRGSIIDIFPMGSDEPFRIDLFDNEIETLRTFDPESQRSITTIEQVEVLPAKEFPLDKTAIARFRNQWHQCFDVDHKSCPIYQDISAGIAPAGIEYYLPLFFDACDSLFDYLPEASQLFFIGDSTAATDSFWRDLQERYESRRGDLQRPILTPAQTYLTKDQLFAQFKSYPQTQIHTDTSAEADDACGFSVEARPEVTIQSRLDNPLQRLESFLLTTSKRVLFCAESIGRREGLLELLQRIDIQPTPVDDWLNFRDGSIDIAVTVAPIERGINIVDPAIVIIPEAELLGERVQQRQQRQTSDQNDLIIRNLTELRLGAPVVHLDHGIGRYQGLQTITAGGETNEFLTLVYANNTKLFVPVANLDLISRYSGADERTAPLHKLGSDQWQKAKRKAAEQVRDAAAELLDIYARRAAREGFIYQSRDQDYQRFASEFPFEETADQAAAINAVIRDMTSPQPMDRLVCGDVGFGKTEVAMRAAFIAALNGKQVAMLVPTTLLAQQHFENFRDRFANWPVQIDVISRFKSAKDTETAEKKLSSGKTDIIIGTHKLLQASIDYNNLGLLIIDEEHRFGVRQKEQLKSLRSEVDILTLTATPYSANLEYGDGWHAGSVNNCNATRETTIGKNLCQTAR